MGKIKLRDYQLKGVAGIRSAYASGKRAPCFVGPTGMGKTIILSYICEGAVSKGKTVCILVHRDRLIRQTSAALSAFGIDHGVIAPKHPASLAPVQIASVYTLARRIEKADIYKSFDLLIDDECQHGVAGQWKKVHQGIPNALRLGVTATPERLDGKPLGDVYDALVMGPTTAELISRGFLSKFDVYLPPLPDFDLKGVRTQGGDYARKDLDEKMNTSAITGCVVSHYRTIADGKRAIAFCVTVDHARAVAEQFKAAGYRAACVDGTMSGDEQDKLIQQLATGEIQVLTSCELISEGVDVPVVEVAILLRPTKSLGLHYQQLGRVLRPAPGKDIAIIIDHVGNCERLGLPDDPQDWSLDGRKKKPKPPPIKTCPKCYCAHRPAPKCPKCGHVYVSTGGGRGELEQRDGKLVKLDAERRKYLAMKKRLSEQRACKSEEELAELGRARGYSSPEGWAKHIWGSRDAWKNKKRARS